MGLYILLAVLAVLVIFICILLIRAALAAKKAEPIGEKPVYTTEQEDIENGERLMKMIECQTVSSREIYDDTEFAKLRAAVKELFPLLHERAEIKYFSEDCWVYKIPGRDESRNILLMSHHDVVAVTGDWTHEKFGEISDGKIWGRGTVDTKTSLFAELSAVEELLAEDFEPACNLYIASGHNEEIFGDGIHEAVKYFEKRGIEFELAIDEGGGVISAPIDGIDCKCAMIAVHEKGYHRINVRAVQGDSEGLTLSDNPVTRVSKFIAEVSALKLTIKMPAQVREMFTALLPYMNFPLRLIFANLWCFEPLLIKLMPKINSQAAAMLGTTCVFGSIESKKGKTPRDNECSASALIRYIDEEDLVGDMEKIRELVDVNTIIGDPITSPDGTIIIPVSKVSFGFVAGGSDLPTKAPKEVFAGGSGAGITINPQAFIVVQRDGDVKMLELGATGNSAIDGIISGVPDLISKIKAIFSKDDEESEEKTEE